MTLYDKNLSSVDVVGRPDYKRVVIHDIVRKMNGIPLDEAHEGHFLGAIYQTMAEHQLPIGDQELVQQIEIDVIDEIEGIEAIEKLMKVRRKFQKQLDRALIKLETWSIEEAQEQMETILLDSIPESLEDEFDRLIDETREAVKLRLTCVKEKLLHLKNAVDMRPHEIRKRARKIVKSAGILIDNQEVDKMVAKSKKTTSSGRATRTNSTPNLSRKSRGNANNPRVRAAVRGQRF